MASNGCSDYISPAHKPDGDGLACAADLADDQGQTVPVTSDLPAALKGWQKPIEEVGVTCRVMLARCVRHCTSTMRMALCCLFVLMLGACQAQGVKGAQGNGSSKPSPRNGQTVMLPLVGYNYTDHYIDNYYVNGAWGGNLFISNATAGGGKYACCFRWIVGQALPVRVRIRWESSECLYTEYEDGEAFRMAKSFYSEKDVLFNGPIPVDPQYFETHFYPDGHIELAISDDNTPPRLKLPALKNGLRPGVKPWPQCTPEQLKRGTN